MPQTTPLPSPPPQGGREHTARVALRRLDLASQSFSASSPPQHAASALADLGDDLCGDRVDLLVGHGLFAGLQRHGDGDRFLAGIDALALVEVEHGHVGDELAVDAQRRALDIGGLHRAVDDESEVALDRLELRELEHGLGARGLGLRLGDLFQDHLEGGERPLDVERLERARMQLAEISEHILRADLDGAAAARMEPGRPARHDLQCLRRRSGCEQRRERVALHVESINVCGVLLGRGARPMAADARRLGARATHTARSGELILRPVAAEDLSDLEQRRIGKAAVGILLRGGDQAGNEARPHVGEVGCDRIGERELRLAAAEQLGVRLRDERPGDGLDQAARGKRALALAIAQLDRRQHRLARSIAAVERCRRHAVDADDAHDLFDDIGLAFDIRAPRRDRDLHGLALTRNEEAEMAEHAAHLGEADLEAGEPRQLVEREVDDALGHHDLAGDGDGRRLAAAEIEHHASSKLEAGQHEGRIDAALETIARIRIDPELAAGLGDVERAPQRGFDQHVGGRLRDARCLAAHDAGEGFHALLVGDHADRVVERVEPAVERDQALAVARAPHREIAVHLGGVEHVQRPRPVEGHEVGDVDERVDRAQPDRGQPPLQPFRGGAVLDAAHEPQPECGTQRRRRSEVERHLDRARELAVDRLDRGVLELAHVGGGEIAGDAAHARAIGAIGRQVDLDHGIVEPGPLRVVFSDRRVGGQVDDALVIVGEAELELGDQHAAALDTADLADAERHVLARDVGAGRHEHARHARARIGCAADDLHRLAGAGVDHAHPQPIRIGMLLGGDHTRDGERRQYLAAIGDALDLEPDHGELVDDLVERLVGLEMLLEPGQREFHGRVPSARVAAGGKVDVWGISPTRGASRPWGGMHRPRCATVAKIMSSPTPYFTRSGLLREWGSRAGGSRSGRASARRARRRRAGRACRISAWRCGRSPCPRRSPGTRRDRGRNCAARSGAPCRSRGSRANPRLRRSAPRPCRGGIGCRPRARAR